MIYEVTAISIDAHGGISAARTEEIDTETNEMFSEARGPWEIEDIYESYWNRLNDSWEYQWPEYKERVKVISVVPR
jgi:hypothetical protein